MERRSTVHRETMETRIDLTLTLAGKGRSDIKTGIPFFDHMLSLFAAHGFFDLTIHARGDLHVDLHHTVEDVGLALGEGFHRALGERKGIRRYGFALTPMDEALTQTVVDLSGRPYLVYDVPVPRFTDHAFGTGLAREFFRAFSNTGAMNLHIRLHYGDNEHHVLESIFKGTARSLDTATALDDRIEGALSTKGVLAPPPS